jgi:translation initiation factor IF-2
MRAFLLANIEQWIGAIVTIASIVIYALNQAFDKSQEQQRQQEAARQRWLAEQRQRSANPGAEVDAFLRDVAQGRPAQPARREVVTAEVVTAERVGDQRLSERHLQSQLGQHMAEFQQHVDQTVDTNDVKSHLDERIHAKFDHAVGRLEQQAERQQAERVEPPKPVERAKPAERQPKGAKAASKRLKAEVVEAQTAAAAPAGPGAETGVLGIFNDPQRLRQAFIMQEALERPRW